MEIKCPKIIEALTLVVARGSGKSLLRMYSQRGRPIGTSAEILR